MVIREAQKKLIELANTFKCVALTGPRQSGSIEFPSIANTRG